MPYHLHNFKGDWSLMAFDTFRNGSGTFLISRIAEWKVLTETSVRDKASSLLQCGCPKPSRYRAMVERYCFHTINPHKARFIRKRLWHPYQRIEENPDGSLVLHMKTAGLVEVGSWVLSFGSDAEVLAPESLRQDCLDEIDNLKKVYQNHAKREYHDGRSLLITAAPIPVWGCHFLPPLCTVGPESGRTPQEKTGT